MNRKDNNKNQKDSGFTVSLLFSDNRTVSPKDMLSPLTSPR